MVTAAVPGHGYRVQVAVVPGCKCGWTGKKVGPTFDTLAYDQAKQQFEEHKHLVRAEKDHPAGKKKKRRLTVIEGGG